MPCREMVMPLAFCASQRLDLPVNRLSERLPEFLQQEERVIASLLDPSPVSYTHLTLPTICSV